MNGRLYKHLLLGTLLTTGLAANRRATCSGEKSSGRGVLLGSKVHDIPLEKEMPPGHVQGFDVRTCKQQ